MTALTKLAALRLQERELLRTPCAKCGHQLGSHSPSDSRRCDGRWDEPPCYCKTFVDPGEKLALT